MYLAGKMTHSGVSFTTIQAPRSHQKILREKKNGGGTKPSLNPNRASYPGSLVTSTTEASSSLVMSTTSSTSSSGERLSTAGTDGNTSHLPACAHSLSSDFFFGHQQI